MVISCEDLLQFRREMWIAPGEEMYRLRVDIITSSGPAILDRAAVEAVSKRRGSEVTRWAWDKWHEA